MSKSIVKKVENELNDVKNVQPLNVVEDVKKLLNTKPIRGFTDDIINDVKNDITNGVSDIEIMDKYALTRPRFKNLIFEIACSGFDVSNLKKSSRKTFLRTFKCGTQGIIITNSRLKQNGINIQPGDNLNFIKLTDESFAIEIIK